MKTAISIDDGLLRQADEAARLLGVSPQPAFCAGNGRFSATILTVDKEELVECSGTLSASPVQAVLDGLHLLFDQL